jgi:hypothetical protein
MDLTAERFAQLILSMNARRIIERSREHRSEQRSGVRYRIMLKVPGPAGNKVHRAWLRDFSSTGLGMATSVMMTSGQAFAIQMQSAGGVIEIPCTTAHCQRVAEEVYNIGARFMDRWYTKLPEAA